VTLVRSAPALLSPWRRCPLLIACSAHMAELKASPNDPTEVVAPLALEQVIEVVRGQLGQQPLRLSLTSLTSAIGT